MLQLLIEKEIVNVGKKQIDIERAARQYPKKHKSVGEEGKQTAAYTEYQCPPSDDGHSTNVCGNIVRMRVVEESDRLMIGVYNHIRQTDTVGYKP